jgi:hypothetical protein
MASIFGRFYRRLFCRGGYGVHSPFAFDLITTVIEEKRAYYCYERLDNIRLQLQGENRKVKCGNKDLTVKKALRTYCFSTDGNRLLFRLANRFHPEKILIIGSGLGLTPLYVSAHSQKTDCIVFEREPSMAVIAREVVRKYARSSVKIYDKIFGEVDVPGLENADFIVWGKGADFSFHSFEHILRYVTGQSIMIICGITGSSADKGVWDKVRTHPEVITTFDLYAFGIIFFNSKLPPKTYKTIPM